MKEIAQGPLEDYDVADTVDIQKSLQDLDRKHGPPSFFGRKVHPNAVVFWKWGVPLTIMLILLSQPEIGSAVLEEFRRYSWVTQVLSGASALGLVWLAKMFFESLQKQNEAKGNQRNTLSEHQGEVFEQFAKQIPLGLRMEEGRLCRIGVRPEANEMDHIGSELLTCANDEVVSAYRCYQEHLKELEGGEITTEDGAKRLVEALYFLVREWRRDLGLSSALLLPSQLVHDHSALQPTPSQSVQSLPSSARTPSAIGEIRSNIHRNGKGLKVQNRRLK